MRNQKLRGSRSPKIARHLQDHSAETSLRNTSPEPRQSAVQGGDETKKPVRINYIVRDLPLY